ncbi:unnamed protein product, partial [Brenthis ino]
MLKLKSLLWTGTKAYCRGGATTVGKQNCDLHEAAARRTLASVATRLKMQDSAGGRAREGRSRDRLPLARARAGGPGAARGGERTRRRPSDGHLTTHVAFASHGTARRYSDAHRRESM